MNEGSVINRKTNHTITVKVGGQIEVCGFSAWHRNRLHRWDAPRGWESSELRSLEKRLKWKFYLNRDCNCLENEAIRRNLWSFRRIAFCFNDRCKKCLISHTILLPNSVHQSSEPWKSRFGNRLMVKKVDRSQDVHAGRDGYFLKMRFL